jgi:type IV secretion system protein VirB10
MSESRPEEEPGAADVGATPAEEVSGGNPAARPQAPGPGGTGTVAGERGIPSVNRARSLQSRVSSMLAIGLMMTLGLGLLTWYYARILARPSRSLERSQAAVKRSAAGNMPLPPLGPIPQAPPRTLPAAAAARVPAPTSRAIQALLGAPPPWPQSPPALVDPLPARAQPRAETPARRALDRRLSGAVFATSSGESGSAAAGGSPEAPPAAAGPSWPGISSPIWGAQEGRGVGGGGGGGERLASLLEPQRSPAVQARVLPTLRFLLPKGAFINCTLETAIDSTLPGMTTCVTATDTFSADGTVVLLERGTKLVGETRGEVSQGQSRVFVLWTEARTPSGVVVPLDSPGTDALGRSGLAGTVERHFWERFGAAILVSVIDGAVQAGVQSTSHGGTVIVNPSGAQDVMTQALTSTIDIPPTVTVPQGARIQVLVARDVDFRSVYRLRMVSAAGEGGGR